jgi:predicted methyltransferase
MITHNQIVNGDWTRILRTLPDESVDFVADPPYFVRYVDRQGQRIANDC